MNKHIRFAYDKESDQYIYMKSVSDQFSDSDTISLSLREVDRPLDNAVRNFAVAAEKSYMFKKEQVKFLFKHRDEKNDKPGQSFSSEEYLTYLDQNINEAEAQVVARKQDVVNALKNAKNIYVGNVSLFLFSFLSGTSRFTRKRMKLGDMEWLSDDFEKETYIVDYFNALTFNNEVKILLTEKDNREIVKIVKDIDMWENIAQNQEYQKMLADQNTCTVVYSLPSDKYFEIEKGLKASTSVKEFLEEKVGGPSAIKHKEKKL